MKFLVVDDDVNNTALIKGAMNFEELGISDIFIAYNGEQAVEAIDKEQPDIILCDIEMPLLDGLGVLKYVYKNGIQAEFILLTCHDQFEYAQTAIRFGASEYLLKPFRMDELEAAIMKAVLTVRSKQEREQSIALVHKNKDYVEQSFLWGLLQKNFSSDFQSLNKVIESRKIDFDVNIRYRMIYAGIHIENLQLREYTETDFYFLFHNLANEVLNEKLNCEDTVEYDINPYHIVMVFVKENSCTKEQMQQRCQKLVDASSRYLYVNVKCLIGEPATCEEMPEMKRVMDERFISGAGYTEDIIKDTVRSMDMGESNIVQDMVCITNCLKNRDKSKMLRFICDYLERLKQDNLLNKKLMSDIHHNLMQIYYTYLSDYHIQANKVMEEELVRKLSDSAEYSIADMIKYVHYMYDRIQLIIEKSSQTETVIEKVQKYIDKNIGEKLERNNIAEYVYLTPNYLSKLFRKKMGLTLSEYINIRRVEKAKILLSATDNSISSIAMDVGFETLPYFSTVFKGITGRTPAAWRG